MTERRSTGRPLDTAVSEAIAKAVAGLLAEVGLAGMSVDSIAARAGVSKASIYRRWSSKEDLVVDVIANLVGTEAVVAPSGDLRHDLIQLLARIEAFFSEIQAGAIFPHLVAEVHNGTPLGRHYAEAVILPRRRHLAGLLGAARDRGDLRRDLDIDLAVDMLTGPVLLKKLIAPFLDSSPNWNEDLVDSLLRSWR